jgi:hypothetical protein
MSAVIRHNELQLWFAASTWSTSRSSMGRCAPRGRNPQLLGRSSHNTV